MSDFPNFKRLIVLAVFVLSSLNVNADTKPNPPHNHKHQDGILGPLKVYCDLCGCGTNGSALGFGDLATTNFVGARYTMQKFESRNGIFKDSPISNETVNNYQVWGRFPISKTVYTSVIVPYQDLKREFKGATEKVNGIGDISAMGWYKIMFYKKQDSVNFNMTKMPSGHSINIGAGVKLPTGRFEQQLIDRVNPGFQVGTGSLDYNLALQYNYLGNKVGANVSASYYIKTENKNEYRFGNQLGLALKTFYNQNLKNNDMAIRPYLGASYDKFNAIEQYQEELKDTDGYLFNGSVGTEYGYLKMVVGVNYTLPISQELFGGNVQSKNQFSVYLNYSL